MRTPTLTIFAIVIGSFLLIVPLGAVLPVPLAVLLVCAIPFLILHLGERWGWWYSTGGRFMAEMCWGRPPSYERVKAEEERRAKANAESLKRMKSPRE